MFTLRFTKIIEFLKLQTTYIYNMSVNFHCIFFVHNKFVWFYVKNVVGFVTHIGKKLERKTYLRCPSSACYNGPAARTVKATPNCCRRTAVAAGG